MGRVRAESGQSQGRVRKYDISIVRRDNQTAENRAQIKIRSCCCSWIVRGNRTFEQKF